MLFNSYPFLLAFLPGAVAVFAIINRVPRLRRPRLLAFSLVFYGYWNPSFVLLLVALILVNWFAAWRFAVTRNGAVITAAIVLNLGVLGLFKYADFFTGSLSVLSGFSIGRLDWVLPLGISFFTFHHIMYLADLRRAARRPPRSTGTRSTSVSFRKRSPAPLRAGRRWGGIWSRCVRPGLGAALRAWHHIYHDRTDRKSRVRRSDRRAPDPIYQAAASGPVHDGSAWIALGFGFQIFFDFSGYSDIAIGIGLLFGIQLPFNFDAPFRATSILEFWQRWHMTLSRFLRDYVFIRSRTCGLREPGTCPRLPRCDPADDGTVRTLAWRGLELRLVGHDARCRHRVCARLAAGVSPTTQGRRMGGDDRLLPAQRRGVSNREP